MFEEWRMWVGIGFLLIIALLTILAPSAHERRMRKIRMRSEKKLGARKPHP